MKTLIRSLSVILLLFSSTGLRAEWKQQEGMAIQHAMASCVISEKARIAINAPYVYLTTDGGQSWNTDSVDVHMDRFSWASYQQVQFTGEQMGFIQVIVGDSNYVYRSADAGRHWKRYWLNNPVSGGRIQFITDDQWIVSGQEGLFVTSDGGISSAKVQRPGMDTGYFFTAVTGKDEWYLFSSNTSSEVNVYRTTDQGSHFDAVARLKLYDDSEGYVYPYFAGIAKTSGGISIVYNIYYPGCGAYYHHSLIYDLHHSVHSWSVKESTWNFNYPVTGFTVMNDTGYITTYNRIYKNVNNDKGWFPVFEMNYYEKGMFQGIGLVNGSWVAYTAKGTIFKNSDPSADRNLGVNTLTGINEEVSVFPNPAHEQVTMRVPFNNATPFTLIVTDLTGREVFRHVYLSGEDITFGTSALNIGQYFYHLDNQQVHYNGQFIIQY